MPEIVIFSIVSFDRDKDNAARMLIDTIIGTRDQIS